LHGSFCAGRREKNIFKNSAMNTYLFRLFFVASLAPIIICAQGGSSQNKYYSINDFQSVKKYDIHIHIETEDSNFLKQAEKDNFHLLNINVAGLPSSIEQQQKLTLTAIKKFPALVHYATTFDVKNWDDPKWEAAAIEYLRASFDSGAIAVKVWKNIGMELKDSSGRFIMIDNPRFDSVLNFISKHKITLLSHQGEPKNCWLPLDKMTVSRGKKYFSKHPQYHMYLHPEYPSYDDQINARDQMIAKHPDLKIVCLHLGSLEWDLDEIAKRLDRFPNMAIDVAARMEDLQRTAALNWKKIRDFFIKYQDRILYGTDLTANPGNDGFKIRERAHQKWVDDWKFFVSNEKLTNNDGIDFKGLKLPRQVINKLYAGNARKWIPGVGRIENQ